MKSWLKSLGWSGYILGLTAMVCRVYFHAGFPYTHDGENHLARFIQYALAIREGQFPPRFAPTLFSRFGYPVFNFNYPLANILSLPFSFLKLNPEITFKVIVFAVVLFGLTGMQRWLSRLSENKTAVALGLGLLAVSPFLLNTIFFRGNIGEILAYCLLPWLGWAVEILKQERLKKFDWLFGVGLLSSFFLSHNTTVVMTLPLLGLYAAVRYQLDWRAWRRLGVVFGIALCLVAWFWLPALFEKSVIVLDQGSLSQQFFNHFPTISELLTSPLRFGFSEVGPVDGLSASIGLAQLAGVGAAALVVLKSYRTQSWSRRRPLLIITAVALLLIALQLPQTSWFWHFFGFITPYLQFPWRLGIFLPLLSSLAIVMAWPFLGRWWRVLLIGVFLWQALAFSRTQAVDYFHRDLIDYEFFTQSTSTNNENRTKTFAFDELGTWQPAPILVEGGRAQVESWRGSIRRYSLDLPKSTTVIESTMNFPGWQTSVKTLDGRWETVSYFNSPEVGGRIAYQLPAGQYQIRSRFTQWTWPRVLGNTLSLAVSLIGLAWVIRQLPRQQAKRFLLMQLRKLPTWILILILFLLWRAILFGLGGIVDHLLPYQPTFPYFDSILPSYGLPRWLFSWANFDGVHYLTIAEHGYVGTALIQAFFPFFPWILLHSFFFITKGHVDTLLVGLIETNIAAFLLWWSWFHFCREKFGARVAWIALALLALFPTSFFFGALYTESIFLLLVIWSFWLAEHRKWKWAVVCVFVASATRIVGVLLIPALLWEYWAQWREVHPGQVVQQVKVFLRQRWKNLFLICLGSGGLLAYMIFLEYAFHDPLYFVHVQAAFGAGRQSNIILFPQILVRYARILLTSPPDLRYITYLFELVSSVGAVFGLLFLYITRRIKTSYFIFTLSAVLLPTLTGTFSSMSRYILVAFPLWLAAACFFARHRRLLILWLVFSTFWLLFTTMLFLQGYWVA